MAGLFCYNISYYSLPKREPICNKFYEKVAFTDLPTSNY